MMKRKIIIVLSVLFTLLYTALFYYFVVTSYNYELFLRIDMTSVTIIVSLIILVFSFGISYIRNLS